jgi:hypothetical protein
MAVSGEVLMCRVYVVFCAAMPLARRFAQALLAAMIFIAPFFCIRFCQLHHDMEMQADAPGELSFLQTMPDSMCGDMQGSSMPAHGAGHAGNSFVEKLNQMLSHLTEFLPATAALVAAYIVIGWVFARQHSLVPNPPEPPRRPPRLALA